MMLSDFRAWIQKTEFHRYQYVVFVTGTAFNLAELLQKEHPNALPDYITENGILLKAEDIAATYNETGAFPKIAVIDSLLIYGRKINLLLSQLWLTVFQCLSQMSDNVYAQEAEKAFIQSIDLWVYAVNKGSLLLRHEYQWNLHSCKVLSERDCRAFADSTACLITKADIANTAYVVSAKLPCRLRPSADSWICEKTLQYQDNQQDYEFYLFSGGSKPGIYPSVRSYKKHGVWYYTPYFFMEKLDWTQMLCLLKAVFALSAKQDLSVTNDCIYLLNRIKKISSRLLVYAQFTTLLLSQITLSAFFENLSPDIEAIYDFPKISRNFGSTEDIESILIRFCKIKWTKSQLAELLSCLEASETIETQKSLVKLETPQIENALERIVYKQAVDHEKDAAEHQRHICKSTPDDSYINQIGEQELYKIQARVKEYLSPDAISTSPVLSCLTQMIDLGELSLKVRSRYCDGIPVFYTSIRTTETSLSIMPRKLSCYYRQFYLLAQLYWRDQNFPDRVERYFQNTIFSGDQEGKYKDVIGNARYFAQLILENKIITESMLNWMI